MLNGKTDDGTLTVIVVSPAALKVGVLLRGSVCPFIVILETEMQITPKNIGKLAAKNKNVKLNLYYTPTTLTNNALIFNKIKMKQWWQQGYDYAKNKSELMSDNLQ